MGCTASKACVIRKINFAQRECHSSNTELHSPVPIFVVDELGQCVEEVGAGGNERLREIMRKGKQEIKESQEKLNSSLTIPIVEAEAKVLETEGWLNERKDLHQRFNVLPPIAGNKRVKDRAMAFEV